MDNSVLIVVNLFAVTLSTIAATVALWVAWDVRKKTTQHLVDIIHTSHSHQESVERKYDEFSIFIKNFGLPIPTMAVSLQFQVQDGLGSASCNLRSIDIVTGVSAQVANDVVCGLVVKFGFLTDQMSPSDKQFLATLVDLRKQRATICVYCSGYLVESFKVDSWSQRRKGYRQKLLWTLTNNLSIGTRAKDQKSWKARLQFADRPSLQFTLGHFLDKIRAQTKGHG